MLRFTHQSLLAVVLMISLGAVAGCTESGSSVVSSSDATGAEAASPYINTACPIMGNEIQVADVTDELVRDWNGKKVAFCCPPCLEDWDEMSDEERAKAVENPPKAGHH